MDLDGLRNPQFMMRTYMKSVFVSISLVVAVRSEERRVGKECLL